MRRPTTAGLRAAATRHRPALLIATGAAVVAMAGGLTGAALAGEGGGHEHQDGPGSHLEHQGGPADLD